MAKILLFGLLLAFANTAWSNSHYPGLQIEVKREGALYTFNASFDSPLSKCAAYQFLTDYEFATNLPGVIESSVRRLSSNQVRVEQTAEELVLFFHVRLHSVLEYTEKPVADISFVQLAGDSKQFHGHWHIEPNLQGSTLTFHGQWEPDTMLPLFIIDHFARNGLVERFCEIANLAEKRKDILTDICPN